MSKPEDVLNSSSKDVFAQPLLQNASLLADSGLQGLNQALASASKGLSLTPDPIAKAGAEGFTPAALPKKAAPLDVPTVFGSTSTDSDSRTTQAGIDPLTGSQLTTQLTSQLTSQITNAVQVTAPVLPDLPKFAVMAEGTLTINGSSDFDGDPKNLQDDALMYGGAGFTINGNPTLPVQRDSNGNPILDASGKPILIKDAVAVASDYTVSNAAGNRYAGLLPPQIVPKQVVNVPAYADIKQQELTRRLPSGTATVTFNAQQNPLNTAADWTRKFPAAGTAGHPTVVQVTNGGLTIPAGVNLSHTIITVVNGDINFNGSGQTFDDVVLVSSNGNINLANVRATDLSVLASGTINMNGGARFGGATLLANGTGDINFNGATTTTTTTSNLEVISQGSITYNGASNTRGAFLSAKNFTFNGNSTLYGAIGAKGNVIFNGNATVIADATITLCPTPPVINAGLTHDTAPGNTTNTDRLTSDPAIAGTITVTNPGIQIGVGGSTPIGGVIGNVSLTTGNQIVAFKAGFDTTAVASYSNVLANLQANGTFSFSRTQLNQIYGGTLPDGNHTLHLQAQDQYCNVTTFDVAFTLDTTTAAPVLTLQTASDSGQSNSDRITQKTTPVITGTAEAGATVQLFSDNQAIGQTTAKTDGTWQFTTPQLTNGVHQLSAIATDIAGNTKTSASLQVTIDNLQPQISLTTPVDQLPLTQAARLTGSVDGTGSAITALSYHFDEFAAMPLTKNVSGAFDQAINFTGISNGFHILTLSATDVAGNVLTTRFNVTVALDTTAPVITAQLVRDTAPGSTNTDRITFDPRITGTLTDTSQIASFKAGFDTATSAQFVDVLAQRQADGHFTFSRTQLEQIYGGTLPDGLHQLHLQAKDEYGNLSSVFTLSFTLDTFTPAPSNLKLAPESDSGQSHYDTITRINTPIITGQAEVGAQVSLYDGNQIIGSATTSADGTWQITTTALTNGTHAVTAIATDLAGNVSPLSQALTITIDALQPQLTFTAPIDAAPLKNDAKLVGTINGTGSAITTLNYRFDNQSDMPLTFNSTGAFNQAFDFTGISNGAHTLTVTAIDVAGNVLTTQYNVMVALDREAPVITAQLVRDTAPGGTNTDRITFDPSISGTVTDANQIVSFRAGFDTTSVANFVDVTVQRQANGSFTFSRAQLEAIYGGPLLDGLHALNLQAQDAFGNRSSIFTLTFTFDTTVLAPNNLQLAAGSDSGQNDHDTITRINAPTIAGNADPKTLVQLYDGSQIVGQTTATDNGTWQITSTQLSNGNHVLTAIATDIAGNVSAVSQPLSVTIDAVLPALTLTTPVDTVPLQNKAKLTGLIDGTGSAITTLSYRFDNQAEISVSRDNTGAFDQPFNFTGINNGTHTLTISATDLAGNVSLTQYTVTVDLDQAAPIITAGLAHDTAPGGATNTDGITADPTITGTISDRSRVVEVWAKFETGTHQSNITTALQANGSFTLDRVQLETIYGGTLPDGFHTLSLEARDEYGNQSIALTVSFTLDTTAPNAPVLDLPATSDSGQSNSDNMTRINPATITGSAEAGTTVQLFVDGSPVAPLNSDGTWQTLLNALADGTHTLTATATDRAGNTSATSTPLVITIDTTAPTLGVTSITDHASLNNTARLVGSTDGTGSAIASLAYRFDAGSELAIIRTATGAFDQAIDFTGITNGTHTLTIVSTDVAGNVTTTQFQVVVALDHSAPVITAALANDTAPGGTNTDRVTSDTTITGSLSDVSQVVAFRAGLDRASPTVDVLADRQADGSFTFTRSRLEQIYGNVLSDGLHTLQLQATDQYGNVSQIFELTFTLDTTLPLGFSLNPAFDSAPVGDNQTTAAKVSLDGQTDAGATVVLQQTGATIVADANGQFTFSNMALALGDNTFTVQAVDATGNHQSTTLTIKRLASNQAPTEIGLSRHVVAENSAAGIVIGRLSTIDPDAADTHTYLLLDNAGGRFKLVGDQLQVAPGAVLDYESANSYTIQVRTTDSGKPGLFFDKTLTVNLTNVNETPRFTSTPVLNAEAGSAYSYTIATTDPEGNARTITTKNLPGWLTLTDHGDGTASLTGTPTTAQSGLYPIALTVTDAGGLQSTQTYLLAIDVVLREGTNFSPTQAATFTINQPSVLSFQIDPSFDTTDSDSINDAFEVALVDANGNSLVHTIAQGRDAFFNWTEGEPVSLGAGATYAASTKTISLNLTGITPGTAATLIFRLVNDDGDRTTSVRIRDIALVDAPLGTQLPTGINQNTTTTPTPLAASSLSGLSDVSSSISAEYHRTTFNADTHLLYTDVAVHNIGTYSVNTPLLVAVTHLSDPSVLVRNPDGYTPDGLPYYNFSSLVADGKLDPSELTSIRSLIFYNPNGVQFTYDLVVLAQLNQAPVIQTQPLKEVLGGQTYRYDVNATDYNGDSLTYKLLVAPNGMTIDAKTGEIRWDTATSNQGNHSVAVQVSDGHGGVTEQRYTLAVTDTLPNRPPIFTSTPTVDAYISQRYAYDADAVDPDQDNPLTYSLVTGPDGMSVDPSTGLVQWTPPPALILGDTVFGRISVPGESDEFTFSGTAGQRLYFDPLQYSGDYSQWRMDIYSPSGQKVIDGANFNWDQNKLVTLLEDGNYRVVVRAQGDKVGSYGFGVINLGLVPVVPFDVVVKGKLSPGSEDDVYRFTGNRGQKLFFDQLSRNGNFDWVLYDAGNQVVQSSYNFDDMEVDLPSNGEYVLALRGRAGLSDVSDYSFSIVTPDLITQPLSLDQVVSSAINEKGEQDTYTFTGTAGQQLFYDALGADANQIVRVYDPVGREIFSTDSRYDRGPSDGLILSMNGTYRVLIDASGENTGAYKFRFLNRASASITPLDTDITGTFGNDGNGSVAYRFTLTESQYLFFDGQQGNGSWLLYGPNGQYVASQDFQYNSEFWLSAGDYLLVAQGRGGGEVNYKLRIITPELSTAAMSVGTPVSGSLSEKGEQDAYTFTGNVGQQLFYDALNQDSSLIVRVYDPVGREIFSTYSGSDRGPDGGLVLTLAGTYRVVVDGNDENIGAYQFRFLNRGTASETALDTDIVGTFSNDGTGSAAYRFTLTESQYLFFDGQQGNGSWLLYGPNGQYVASQDFQYNSEFWLSAGDYLLVAQGRGGGEVNYKLRIITPELTTTGMRVDAIVSGSLSEKGEQDAYTFTGNVGQQLFYDALNQDSSLIVRVYDPVGREIFSTYSGSDRGPDGGLVLTLAGTYRVVVDGNDENTGAYQFRFLDKAAAQEKVLGDAIEGTFDHNGLGSAAYRFTLTESRSLFFDGQQGYGAWILYGPNGQYVTSQNFNSDRSVQLQAGNYFLVAQGYGGGEVNYKLQIIDQGIGAATTPTGTAIAFGSDVEGTITQSGQQKAYTFTGTAGQQLFYDALGGTYDIVVRIYDATGRQIFATSSPYDQGPNQGLTLTADGTYQVIVNGEGATTGNYKFRLLDRAAATPVTLDSDITGAFDHNGLGSATYRFTVTGDQYVYIDGQRGGGQWTIYGPNGQYVDSQYTSYDKERWLSAGEYLLVVQGNGSEDPNYKLRLVTPELVVAPMTVGSTVIGSIGEKGEQDTYTFNGSAGQQLFYDSLGGNYNIVVYVYDPAGRQVLVTSSPYDRGPDQGLTLTTTGTYRVVVDGEGETTGDYKFRFLDKAAATEVSLDTDITGRFDNDGLGSTAYRFTLNQNQYLFFDGQQGNGQWTLYGPNGQVIVSQSVGYDYERTLAAGEYLLVMQGYGGGDVNYKLRIITPQLNATGIAVNTVVNGSIGEKGEQDTYTFNGSAGQQLFYDSLGGNYNIVVYVYDPAGRQVLVTSSPYDRGPDQGLTLTTTGTYRVVVDGEGETTGDYKFRFLDKATATEARLNTDLTGTFDNNGLGSTAYRFTLTNDQYVFIDGQQGNGQWTLYGPNGQYVIVQNISYDSERWLSAGEYFLVAQGYGGGESSYKLRIVTPEFSTTGMTVGNVVTGTLGMKGEQDTYTFNGSAGQQLFYDALNGSSFRVKLYDPIGREVLNADSRYDRGPNENLVLSMTGTYRVVIDADGEGTGDYQFRFFDKATATPVQFDTEITGTFANGGIESDVYRFAGVAGQRVYLDTGSGQAYNGWILYGPGGQRITSGYVQDGYYDDYEFALPTTGEYLLVMQGNGADNVNYKFRLNTPDFLSAPLTLGTTTSGSISEVGEIDTYTFAGTVGQQLFFDALIGNNSLKARLIGPSGVVLLDKSTSSDWGAFNLPETGTYQLVIDGDRAATGNYCFTLMDRAKAPTLTLGNAITGRLTTGNQVSLYQFNGQPGQRLKFDLAAASWSGANWLLYDPNGGIVKAPAANSPDFNATLGTTGLYTLAIIGDADAPVSYQFQVTDSSQGRVSTTGFGVVQHGTLTAGQVNNYAFTAAAGTLMLFDGQTSDATGDQLRTRLLNPDGTIVFDNADARLDRGPLLLEQAGTYQLQTYGASSSVTGDYQFNLLELPNSFASPNFNYLELGGVVSSSLNARQGKVYTFDGVAGQKLVFNAMTGQSVRAALYDAHGNQLFSSSNFGWQGDNGPLTLTEGGLHYLVLENDEATSHNYSFQVLDLTTATEIRDSILTTGALQNGQQSQFFKLQAKAGERLFFDTLSSSAPNDYYRWKLLGPGNTPLYDADQHADFEVTVSTTGEYYLEIQGGDATGKVDYSFRLLRHEPAIRDVITPGTGETTSSNADALGLFPVEVSVKDSKGASSVQAFNVKLLPDPTNGMPVITSTPKTRFALSDGTYRYQLQSVDPDGDALTYRLLDAPLGAVIDRESGELLWFPEGSLAPGSTASFQVEVSDRRGGKAVQAFNVAVFSHLGKIQGAVFDDLNSNGLLDTKLVQGDNPSIVFALDISGSTAAPFAGQDGVRTSKTVLDAEVTAALALIQTVIAQGAGDRVKFAILPHQYSAYIQDMDPATAGLQVYTTALADNDHNGVSDLQQILESYRPTGGNDFTNSLQAIDSLVGSLPGTPNLIYLSDGYGRLDETVARTVVADIKARGGNVTAFGVGQYSTIDTIRKIDPNAERLTDFHRLIDIFSGLDDRYAVEPMKAGVTVYLDLNNNGELDASEPFQITQKKPDTSLLGRNRYYYTFDDLLPGAYTLRTLVPNGYTLTTGGTDTVVDTVTATGGDFFHLAGLGKLKDASNQDPKFFTTPPTLTTLKAGETLLYRSAARDADADPVTYDLILAPAGMTVEAKTGTVVWTPTKQQVEQYYQVLQAEQDRLTASGRGAYARTVVAFDVLLRAKDGKGGQDLQYVKVQLLPDNTAPLFTSTLADAVKPQVGKPFQYQAQAIDAEGDALTYALLPGAPNGMTIDASTGLVHWTPNAIGAQAATIQVTDGKGGTSLQALNLTVQPATANQAPTITSTPRTTTRLGNTYFYALEAADPDGDRLTYSLLSAPSGMTLKEGVISWTPTAAQSGTYTVTVKASDGALATTQTFALTVSNQTVNHAPTITSAPNLITNAERTYTYDLTGGDPDGDVTRWSLAQAPQGMVLDAATGALRWQPKVSQVGTHQVVVKLTDNYGLETTQTFMLKVTGTNTPPAIVSTPITRAAQGQAYAYTVVATDPENDVVSFSLGRRPDGMTIDPDGTLRWTPQANQVGDQVVEVLATDTQGGTTTQRFTLAVGTTPINQAPTITSAPVFLAAPGHGYVYQVQASDPDAGDTLTYQLLKAPTGVTIDAATGKVEWTTPLVGTYQIVVGAVDAQGVGAAQGFTLTVRENHAPVITSTATETAALGTTYRYDVRATDGDGDKLSYSLDQVSVERGMAIDALGRLVWTPKQADLGQTYSVTLSVTDEQGAVTPQMFSLTVAQDMQAPNVTVFATQDPIAVGGTVTLIARATDNVSVANLTLVVDGKAVVLNANGRATLTIDHTGNIQATATATDASNNQTVATTTIHVVDPNANFDPSLSFDFARLKDGVITAPTDLIGTVEGSGIVRYELAIAPVSGGAFKTIFTGTSAVHDGVLGKFDPSLLENDSYTIRLTAFDANGNASAIEDTVNVAGDLKLGNFRLSFTDLSIPVTGIPITLTRTYDSLTSGTSDDFGYGWRMEFRDTDLRTSLKRTPEEELLGTYPAFKDGTRVYITLPGGKREGFTFKPTGDRFNSFFGDAPEAAMYHPAFTADKGITDTLTVRDTRIVRSSDTNQYGGLAGNPYNPADPTYGGVYVLTTKEGIVYEIDAQTGDLLTVTDTNGNKLTYTDASITSSTGQKVTFERDAQNRITSVKDPLGELVRYEYDAKGDLVGVTDRENNTTRMEYNSAQPHYLDKIIDPLGHTGVKTEYDENGRLKTMVDADGKPVGIAYDPANSLETVTDQLGHKTTYEYDSRGNVVTEIDAEGRITKRTYNDNNDVLAETVISDRSDNPLTSEFEGFTTRYTYDDQRNKLTETDALGNTTYYTYGALNRLLTETDALGRTTTYTYDSKGNLTSTKDAKGQTTGYGYDLRGQLLSVEDAKGQSTKFAYDERGNVLSVTDALNNTTTYTYNERGDKLTETRQMTTTTGVRDLITTWTYDDQGRVETMTDAEQHTTTYEYDALGRQVAVIDALGRRTESIYNDKGELIETIYPDATPETQADNTRTRTEYDLAGRRTAEIDQLGRVTRFVYDKVGRLIETIAPDATPDTDADNPITRTEYYTDGMVKAQIDERGNRTEFRYDADGRQVKVLYADATPADLTDNPYTQYVYDDAGQQTAVTDALKHTTRYVYDDLGRLTKTIFQDQTVTTSEYDTLGRRVALVDQEGHRTEYRYDALGRLTGVKDARNQWTEYGYDELGHLLWQEDANDHRTRYEYDDLGRRTATVLTLGQRSTMTYDAVGNLHSMTDFNGETTVYRYDERNWLIEQEFADDPTVSMTYTRNGLIETVTDGRGITQFEYDERDRLTKRIDPDGKWIAYGYDVAGNRTLVKTALGETRYTFDARNWLDTVIAASGTTDYDYNAVGNLTHTHFGNGTEENRSYDTLNRLKYLENKEADGDLISSYTYTLDKAGNRQSVAENTGRTVNYTYDELYRLTQEQVLDAVNGNHTSGYIYDNVGNRLTKTDSAEGTTTYTYDNNDRLLAEKVDGQVKTTYTYDDNGNTLTKTEPGQQTNYTWDDQNRLVAADIITATGTKHLEYEYDTSGIRVASKVDGQETRYLIDANQPYAQVLEEYTIDGTVLTAYVYGNDLLSQTQYDPQNHTGSTTYYHVDGLGSTTALTDETGTVVSTSRYDAFGKKTGETGTVANQYLFAGEQYDQNLGDYYLRARYYDTDTGRFIRRDTFEGRIGQPLTLHKYIYGNGNPVNLIDPTGYEGFAMEQAAAAAIFTILAAYAYHITLGSYHPEPLKGYGEDSRPRTVLDGLFAWKNTWSAPTLRGIEGSQPSVPAHTGFPLNIGDLVRYVFSIDEVAYDIAHGHAWRDHLLDWSNLGIETQQELAEHIEDVINHSTESKSLPRGRTAHWDETSKTLVIEDPGDSDGGTAFRPREGKAYFDGL